MAEQREAAIRQCGAVVVIKLNAEKQYGGGISTGSVLSGILGQGFSNFLGPQPHFDIRSISPHHHATNHKSVWQYFWKNLNLKEVWFEVIEMHQKGIVKFRRSSGNNFVWCYFFPQSDSLPGLVHSVLRLVGIVDGNKIYNIYIQRVLSFSDGVLIFCSLNHSKLRDTFVGRKQKQLC